MINDYLKKEGIIFSNSTIRKYMAELSLTSIVRRKKPLYLKGKANKIFPNLLNQNFKVDKPNRIWCTDFTYLPQKDGSMRYNCTIIDLYDRCVIATLNGTHIDSQLAIATLNIALKRYHPSKGLILHSDQGCQFTSAEFNKFCKKHFVQQSMSRAGCPYDNAPMERFYNTLKNEYFNIHKFNSTEELDKGIYDFILVKYNHLRPHSYNNGIPLFIARYAA